MPVRMAFDVLTSAAMVTAVCLHPRRLPGTGWIAVAAWSGALALVIGAATGALPHNLVVDPRRPASPTAWSGSGC